MTSIGPVSPNPAPQPTPSRTEQAPPAPPPQPEPARVEADARYPMTGQPRAADDTAPTLRPAETAAGRAELENLVREIAGPSKKGQINEERLYAGLLYARIHQEHGQEAAAQFKEAFDGAREPGERKGFEARANEALVALVQEGALSKRQAARLRSEAFAAAQLDKNKSELNDGRGSDDDKSVARAPFDEAMDKAARRLAAFADGMREPKHRPFSDLLNGGLDEEQKRELDALIEGKDVTEKKQPKAEAAQHPMRAAAAGPATPKGPTQQLFGDGFLWKPVSETTGKLVTLFPPEMTGQIAGVTLRDANGQILEQGDYASVANGGREHFRFDRPGGAYPPGVTVEVQLKDGSTKNYPIPDPAMRAE